MPMTMAQDYRDGNNGPYDGKQKECSNKRA